MSIKSSTTGELRSSSQPQRALNATRTSQVLVAAFLGTLALYIYLAITTQTWQIYVLAAVTFFASLLNILAYRNSRRGRAEGSAYLMIAGIMLVFPVATALLSGVGLVLGLVGLVGIFIIATLTLIPPQLTAANVIGVVFSISLILFDLWYPNPRLVIPLLNVYIPVVAVIGLGIFTYYLSLEFSNYPLRTKLILFFIIVSVFSVGAAAIVSSTLARNEITQQVGRNQSSIAERIALETGNELEKQIEVMQAAAAQFEEFLAGASEQYTGENEEIIRRILELDETWQSADDEHALIQNMLNNEMADELHEFRESFPVHVEAFLTDKYGANVAATNRTSDYYQADEEWWQVAYSLGGGQIYIGQPEFDESSQTHSIILAIPIFAEDELVGIFRSTLDVTVLLDNLQQSSADKSYEIDLKISENGLLSGEPLDLEELPDLNEVMGGSGEVIYKGQPSLVSHQRVFTSEGSRSSEAVSDLGWSIIVHQDVDDALQPVQQQTRTITLVAVGVAVIAGLLGLFAAQRIAAPILSLTEAARQVSEGNLSIRAQVSTQDEIGGLAGAFNRMTNQLQDTLGGLERRIAERTADVELARLVSERRAQELRVVSEVARTISTEQRLEILLPLVARLMSERFNFYHVGIFFIDPTRQFAVLQAANSEGGKRMLARGHRLEVGLTGIVGTVAQTGKTRIALDVGTDAVFFDNPDLPNTRSEMALPLNFRGATIGVLDVQSTQPGVFTEEEANTLSILADQVAIAIENARLFGQSQQARDEAETLYTQFLRTEWKNFLRREPAIGYQQSAINGRVLNRPVNSEEIRQALENGRVVVVDGQNGSSQAALAIPVQLRGQTIGVLNIKAPVKHRKWNQDEITLAQAISDRLALALDNARLLQESQRRAAKEAKIGEVTAKIGASINMRNVLQTAVEELGRALPGAEVVIQFDASEEK